MRSEDLERALGATPASFAARMDQTLRGLKEEKEVKRMAFRTIMVFALVVAVLCTTAFALVSQGLEWYYSHRFTAYQEYEPEKYSAIMENLQTELTQTPANDPEIDICVAEASWAPEQKVLVISVAAAPKNPETAELHPLWNLDADGAYVGGENLDLYADDEEARGEHWLWTEAGYGPVEEMTAPGKKLLLLDNGAVCLDDIRLLGDVSSVDAYVTEEGVVHTVIEVRLEDFFDPAYADKVQAQIECSPDSAEFWRDRLAEVERVRQIIGEDGDGVLTLTLPYTVTAYSDDDEQLYHGGRQGEVRFELKIR